MADYRVWGILREMWNVEPLFQGVFDCVVFCFIFFIFDVFLFFFFFEPEEGKFSHKARGKFQAGTQCDCRVAGVWNRGEILDTALTCPETGSGNGGGVVLIKDERGVAEGNVADGSGRWD